MAEDAPLRVVTAAASFYGHGSASGFFLSIFLSMGCEDIHLVDVFGAVVVASLAI